MNQTSNSRELIGEEGEVEEGAGEESGVVVVARLQGAHAGYEEAGQGLLRGPGA